MTTGGLAAPARARIRLRRAVPRTFRLVLPAMLVAVVVCSGIARESQVIGGGANGLVLFGQSLAARTEPPAGAVLARKSGYDGQFYYVLATDPLLLRDSTIARMAGQQFRAERIGYPAVAALWALASGMTVAESLLVVNVVVLLVGTVLFGRWLQARELNPLWAAVLGLLPGFLLASLRDLTDVLAAMLLLGGLIAWTDRRRWAAAALLSFGVITRELTMLAVVGLAAEVTIQLWQVHRRRGNVRALIAAVWPVVVVPTLVFLGWHSYMDLRGAGFYHSTGTGVPIVNLVHQLVEEFRRETSAGALWDGTFVVLTLIAFGVAIRSAARTLSGLAFTAVLGGIAMLVNVAVDYWGDARVALGLYVPLLLLGVQRRDRTALGVCSLAALMTPWMLGIRFP